MTKLQKAEATLAAAQATRSAKETTHTEALAAFAETQLNGSFEEVEAAQRGVARCAHDLNRARAAETAALHAFEAAKRDAELDWARKTRTERLSPTAIAAVFEPLRTEYEAHVQAAETSLDAHNRAVDELLKIWNQVVQIERKAGLPKGAPVSIPSPIRASLVGAR